MDSKTDIDVNNLVEQVKNGDESAVASLLNHYRSQLRRMVATRVDPELAARVDPSDIVQEALLVASQRLGDYVQQPEIPFYPWLRRITQDRLADAYRRHVTAGIRSVQREQAQAVSDESAMQLAQCVVSRDEPASQALARREMAERVRSAINKLSESERDVLVLRYVEQHSVAQTAEALGIGISAVKVRHLRAVRRLRRMLVKHNEDEPK